MDINKKKGDTELTYSICEVKIDGKMALVSLYDDLPHFEYDMTIDKLKSSNNKLKILVQELEQHIRKLEKEHSQLKTTYGILSNNIASLYKTACKEIKRKDIMINELRNSCSKIKPLPGSKMFSSSTLHLGKTQLNELANEKQDICKTTCDEEKYETMNQNDCANIPSIVVEPNNDIPKTVYYKRLCQKLTKQNESMLSKNNSPKYYLDTHSCAINLEKTQEKNVCLTNDQNVFKELESPVLCNDFTSNLNFTLITCEPDLPPSDSEQSTTSVIQCDNSVKIEENDSKKPSSLKLRPKKCKKKFVISPVSIGVNKKNNETSKCIEKLRKNKNLDLKVVHDCMNPLESKLIKNPIEIIQPKSVEELSCNINANIDDKHAPKKGIVHNQKVFTRKINNKTPPVSDSILRVLLDKKTATVKNDTVQPTKVKNSSKVAGSCSLNDNLKTLAKSSISNEHKSLNQPLEKKNEVKCMLNDTVESSPKSTPVQTNPINCTQSKIHPVKVTTVKKSTPVISSGPSDDNNLTKSTEYVNCSSKNNEKESSQTKKKNNQRKSVLNDNVKSSPKYTAAQANVTNNISKPSNNNKTRQIDPAKVVTLIKHSQVISLDPSGDNDCNMPTKYVNCSPVNNQKESSQYKEEKNQLKCISHDTVKSSPINIANETNITNPIISPYKSIETRQNNTFNVTRIRKTLHGFSLGLSDDNDCNMSTEYVNCSSINNKKESSRSLEKNNQLKRASHTANESFPKNMVDKTNLTNNVCTPYKSIKTRQNDTFKVIGVRKSPQCISFNESNDQGSNVAVRRVKSLSNIAMKTNIKNELSDLPKQTNSQLKCKENNIINSSSFNLAVETSPSNKTSAPFKNIEGGQVPTRIVTDKNHYVQVIPIKKTSRVVSLGPSADNDCNSVTKYVKCSPIIAEKESCNRPIEKNDQLGFKSNNVIKSTSVDYESKKFSEKVKCFPIKHNKDSTVPFKQNDNPLTCKSSINNCKNDLKEVTKKSNDRKRSFSKSTAVDCGKTKVLPTSIDLGNKLACSNLSLDENNQEFKRGRRVQLITIQDHYSEPLPSFNGAKKTEIDVSKNSVHIEKEVVSSSRFYVPQVKKRKFSNIGGDTE